MQFLAGDRFRRALASIPTGVALRAIFLAAAVSACAGDNSPIPKLDGPITLSASSLWAGSTLTLESDDFAVAVSSEPALYVVTEVVGQGTGRYRFTLPPVR